MATSLTGLTPSTTYDALIKVGDNGPIDGTLKVLSDGLGNDLPIQASTTAVNFTGALTQSGNTLQPTLVSGTSIKTVNSTSLLGSGDIAVQPTLVSGTNIKTLNSVSLLGSGDIVLTANPSGVAGAIQFSNGSAFASDAANLFWDDTNNRLGVGTNAPTNTFEIASTSASPFKVATTAGYFRSSYKAGGSTGLFDFIDGTGFSFPTDNIVFGTSSGLGARVGIKGSGATSATTSFLVQNSAGTEMFKVRDDGQIMLVSPSGLVTIAGTNELRIGTTGFAESFKVFFDGAVGLKSNAIYIDASNKVAMGTISPNASAKLQIDSTVSGFACPRMTTTQKNAIASPLAGLQVYDTTTNKLCCYNGSTWNDLF